MFRLPAGASTLDPLVPPHAFASPQTPALSPDGRSVLVPDWTLGLFAMPLAGGAPEPAAAPADLVTAGIDGLLAVPGGLLAVQNGIVVPRLVRLWLTPDQAVELNATVRALLEAWGEHHSPTQHAEGAEPMNVFWSLLPQRP